MDGIQAAPAVRSLSPSIKIIGRQCYCEEVALRERTLCFAQTTSSRPTHRVPGTVGPRHELAPRRRGKGGAPTSYLVLWVAMDLPRSPTLPQPQMGPENGACHALDRRLSITAQVVSAYRSFVSTRLIQHGYQHNRPINPHSVSLRIDAVRRQVLGTTGSQPSSGEYSPSGQEGCRLQRASRTRALGLRCVDQEQHLDSLGLGAGSATSIGPR